MADTTSTGHPKGLYFLFFTEMWERFSYYGMRAIFILFMTKMLFLEKSDASNIYGSYTGLVYLTPLLGGYLSDKFLGNRRSIMIGGLLMAIGQFFMFLSASSSGASAISMMWLGLTSLIIGNGFFKPNISTMVGQLYPANDRRIDSAFTIFYMGINLGAFFSPLVCGTLAEKVDYKWGFLAACIGMVISLISFAMFQKKMLISEQGKEIGLRVKKLDFQAILTIIGSIGIVFFMLNFKQMFKMDLDIVSYVIYGAMIAVPALILSDKSLNTVERNRIIVIFILAFFVIFFWGAFEQAGASLTLFADQQTNRTLGNWEMPASYFQSINPLAIIALAPIFTILWGILHKRKAEPSSARKMAIGLMFVALGYVVIAFAVRGLAGGEKISMWWLVALYLIHTMGELCLSPIGLSMVSKLSPIRLSSLMMGTWFLANAAANKFAGTLSALIPEDVKIEKSFANTTDKTNVALLDTAMLDAKVWKANPQETTLVYSAHVSLVKRNNDSKSPDSIASIVLDENKVAITNFQLQLIKGGNKYVDRVILFDNGTKLLTQDSVEKIVDKVQIKEQVVQVWDLKPEKPKFMGMLIDNLFNFFMLFIIMTGVAAVILYFLSNKLEQMSGNEKQNA